jgi:hypothetical protein
MRKVLPDSGLAPDAPAESLLSIRSLGSNLVHADHEQFGIANNLKQNEGRFAGAAMFLRSPVRGDESSIRKREN